MMNMPRCPDNWRWRWRASDPRRWLAANLIYGIIVHVGIGRRRYDFPLCGLEAADKKSQQYQIVDDYRTWSANR